MPGPLLPSRSQWLATDDELEENTKQHETIKATNNLNDNISEAASVDTIEVQEERNINSEALAYRISLDDCKLSDVESVGTAQGPTDTYSMGDSPGYSSGIDSEASSDIQEDTVMEEEVLEQQFEGFHQALFWKILRQ